MADQTTHEALLQNTQVGRELLAYFQGHRTSLEQDRAAHAAAVNTFIQNGAAQFPVTPNLLADVKYWASLCGGIADTEMELFAGHADSSFSASFHAGSTGAGTVEVVSFENFDAKGISVDGELYRAVRFDHSGSDFKAVLIDVTVDPKSDGSTPNVFVLNQGCPRFTGWSVGEFKTQSKAFFKVLECTGEITLNYNANAGASVRASGADLSEGWVYRSASQNGFGGCHQPRFSGAGHMKLAIALPYWGFGDHGDNFIFANSVGRYSHGEDRLLDGYSY